MTSSLPARLLIAGGRVVDPATRTVRDADVAIIGDTVAAIGPRLSRQPADQVIDAAGCLVTPGLIDPHVHLREPGNERAETIASGTAAAVAGGFTSVCCMPNTTPALDSDSMVRLVRARAAESGACRVFPVAAITKGRQGGELAELMLMARSGAVGFSDDGDCVAAAGMMARALAAIKATGKCLMQHCQDHSMTRTAVMHAGEVSVRLELGGWPRAAEEIIIERDVRLNRTVGCAYHVQHMSSAGSVDIVRTARAAGQPVTAEVTPHHLLLTCDLIESSGFDTRYKMNPPLREASDIAALKKGVADGTITVLGTDHAPHTAESKDVPFDTATFGITGLETAFALYAQALVHDGVIDFPHLIDMMTLQPARLCGLDACGLGTLTEGGPADVTVIDPDLRWTISTADLASQSRNTPFLGRAVTSRPILTVVGGHIRHQRSR
jgi:dihydroorotase